MKANNKYLPYILTVCMLTPFANDIFVPAFPEMMQVFQTQKISLVMTVFLFSLACGQIFYGPLYDRFGRRPVMIAGLSIFSVGSMAVLLAPSFGWLLVARVIQALGGCATVTGAFAIVKDSYAQANLVKAMSLLVALVAVCPTIAPLLGSILQVHFGWQGSFVFLLLAGVFYFFVILLFFRETLLEKNYQALQVKHIFGNYKKLLAIASYRYFILTSACFYAVLFAYVAMAPIIMIKNFALSEMHFGYLFTANAAILIALSLLTPKLSGRFGLANLVSLGGVLLLLGSSLTLVLNLIFQPSLYLLYLPMFITTTAIGLLRPSTSSAAMSVAPKQISGSASALFNLTIFTSGGLSTFIIAHLPHLTNVSFAWIAVGFAGFGVVFAYLAR